MIGVLGEMPRPDPDLILQPRPREEMSNPAQTIPSQTDLWSPKQVDGFRATLVVAVSLVDGKCAYGPGARAMVEELYQAITPPAEIWRVKGITRSALEGVVERARKWAGPEMGLTDIPARMTLPEIRALFTRKGAGLERCHGVLGLKRAACFDRAFEWARLEIGEEGALSVETALEILREIHADDVSVLGLPRENGSDTAIDPLDVIPVPAGLSLFARRSRSMSIPWSRADLVWCIEMATGRDDEPRGGG